MKIAELLSAVPHDIRVEIKRRDPKLGCPILSWYGKAEDVPGEYLKDEIAFIAPFIDNRIAKRSDDPEKITMLKIIVMGE